MKSYFKLIALSCLMLYTTTSDAQVLISLLFGDMLNTEKIEFGLIGGDNISWIHDIEGSKGLNNFNIGFYFHILLKNQSYVSTGVLVKSNVGATGMPTYSVGDPDFDEIFEEGILTKKISYFYVPVLFQQRFHNNRWYLEGGFQLGLRNGGKDIFDLDANDGELEYKTEVKSDYKHLDAGLLGGVGYKFKKEIKSIAAGVNYYYGLMNVSRIENTTIKNSSIYFYVKIPIGAGGKKKKAEKKEGLGE